MICSRIRSQSTVVTEPVIVFEVLSDGTAHDDLVLKNAEYRATPSIQRYVVLQQTHAGAIVFTRKGDDWVTEIVNDTGILRMPEIGTEIPMSELYTDNDLASEPDQGMLEI